MRTKTFILITFVYAITLFADSPKTGTIIVEVEGFGNEKGIVFSHLYSEQLAEFFPTKSSKSLHKRIVKVNNFRATIIYENIQYGTYALTVHHDEDDNKRMNRNFIGYPKEGFGLSNNPTIFLSVPDFDECKFELRKDTIVVKIKLKFV
ncbi:MAG: hypothetical protein CVV22_10565 [Ignavibacteriae bacterium HGW-Ignavibacteriae-1]|jgi:uncharacterized protein (DUF2141 family)|nr:MAG: hypothetical protein CVV22_10565 [Ignavibacteriae bacterium HGW-Ignavibacteriae-1]